VGGKRNTDRNINVNGTKGEKRHCRKRRGKRNREQYPVDPVHGEQSIRNNVTLKLPNENGEKICYTRGKMNVEEAVKDLSLLRAGSVSKGKYSAVAGGVPRKREIKHCILRKEE